MKTNNEGRAQSQPELSLVDADHQPDGADAATKSDSLTQTDKLVALGGELQLFHDSRARAYARTKNGQVLRVGSLAFRRFLRREYRRRHGRAASTNSIHTAVEELASQAIFDGDQSKVFIRVAGDASSATVDMGDADGNAVLIRSGKWEIGRPSAVFDRPPTTRPLPTPIGGGSIDSLKELVNVETEGDLRLIVGWLLMALRPAGPYPILVLQGEPGSAKSTATEVVKRLIDPAVANLRSLPRSDRDLAVTADKSWVLAFDNVSFLGTSLSDSFCKLSTGGGFATRMLFTDDEEVVFEQMRPIIVNGLDAIATRQDLLSRSIVLRLPVIEDRLSEDRLWARFDELAPAILGALLDATAVGLAYLPHVKVADLPRMADFARWVTACEISFGWPEGSIVAAFKENQENALITSLEGSPLATAVLQLLSDSGEFGGTPTELLAALNLKCDDDQRKSRTWPKSAQSMSSKLTLLAPAMRKAGVVIRQGGYSGRGRDKSRWIELYFANSGDAGAGGDA